MGSILCVPVYQYQNWLDASTHSSRNRHWKNLCRDDLLLQPEPASGNSRYEPGLSFSAGGHSQMLWVAL
jgi:hypothetical protein